MPAADVAKILSRNGVLTGVGHLSNQKHPEHYASIDLEFPRPRYEQGKRRVWLWGCDNCGHSGDMTCFIEQCPECQHHRCNNCPLVSSGGSSSHERPRLCEDSPAKICPQPSGHSLMSDVPNPTRSPAENIPHAPEPISAQSLPEMESNIINTISPSQLIKYALYIGH